MRTLFGACLLLLGACSGGESEEPRTDRQPTPAPDVVRTASPAGSEVGEAVPPANAPATIAGEWRLAGIDGEPFDAPFGLAISISKDRISFENCQQVAWTYRYEEGRLVVERVTPATPPCAAPLPLPLPAMVSAMDAAERAETTEANGLLLSGGGRSLTLFSQ